MKHIIEVPFVEHQFEGLGEAACVLTVTAGGFQTIGISPSDVKRDPAARDRVYNLAAAKLDAEEKEAKQTLKRITEDREYLVQAYAYLWGAQRPDCVECDGLGVALASTGNPRREDTRGREEVSCRACRGTGKGSYPPVVVQADFSAAEQRVIDNLGGTDASRT